jgi:hypothetical protein
MNVKESVVISVALIQIVVFLGGMVYWAATQQQTTETTITRIDKLEGQLLIWLEDAELQAKEDKAEILQEIDENREKIRNTNNFLIRKFPEYQTYD